MSLTIEQQQFIETLYQNHRGIMVVTARRTLAQSGLEDSSQYIEEAIQDGILRLIYYVDKLQQLEEKPLLSYIVKTIQSAATEIRRKIERVEAKERSLQEAAEVTGQEAHSDLEDQEAKRELREIIDRLPTIYGQVIWLVFFENKDYQEIAKELNISQDTVRKRVERGKQKLREQLEKGGTNDQEYH